MSRFNKIAHVLWHRQYHLIWAPKYRYKIIDGEMEQELKNCISMFCQQAGCSVQKLNVQADHAHLDSACFPKDFDFRFN